MEVYPSLVEGNGLENRQVVKAARGFESHCFLCINSPDTSKNDEQNNVITKVISF